ncbi:MAG: Rpo12/RPC10 RNA polymerase subunit family protein [Candidatus Thorarchaeota archaeon]
MKSSARTIEIGTYSKQSFIWHPIAHTDWWSSMTYICHFCHAEVTKEGLKALPGVKCPHCGGRILYKIRPPVVKRVKGV